MGDHRRQQFSAKRLKLFASERIVAIDPICQDFVSAAVPERWISRTRQVCYFKSEPTWRFVRGHREIMFFDCLPKSSIMSLVDGRNRQGGLKRSNQNCPIVESASFRCHIANLSPTPVSRRTKC